MRNLHKLQEPQVLIDNGEAWTNAYADNPSDHNKYRYRDPEIKSRLREETFDKCAYCEVKMLPVAAAHIDHKIPVSVDGSGRFRWANLTLACPECNRRKSAFYDEHDGFLDPYADDVEMWVTHRGPIAGWLPGNPRAELSVKYLGLDGPDREELILKKIEVINSLDDAIERYRQAHGTALEAVHRKRLKRRGEKSGEFSAMIRSIYRQYGLAELL